MFITIHKADSNGKTYPCLLAVKEIVHIYPLLASTDGNKTAIQGRKTLYRCVESVEEIAAALKVIGYMAYTSEDITAHEARKAAVFSASIENAVNQVRS